MRDSHPSRSVFTVFDPIMEVAATRSGAVGDVVADSLASTPPSQPSATTQAPPRDRIDTISSLKEQIPRSARMLVDASITRDDIWDILREWHTTTRLGSGLAPRALRLRVQ